MSDIYNKYPDIFNLFELNPNDVYDTAIVDCENNMQKQDLDKYMKFNLIKDIFISTIDLLNHKKYK